jgi:hypothetical protein
MAEIVGFLSSRRNWVLPPPHPQEIVVPPLWVQGGDTLACGGGGGGTQLRRWDRRSGTQGILYSLCESKAVELRTLDAPVWLAQAVLDFLSQAESPFVEDESTKLSRQEMIKLGLESETADSKGQVTLAKKVDSSFKIKAFLTPPIQYGY